MKIISISSAVPGWYDPAAPGFEPPEDWTGARVRITVPVSLDPRKELAAARTKAARDYPGATVDVVPDYQTGERPDEVNVKGTDREILAKYLEQCPPPAGYRAEQVIAYLDQYLPHGAVFGIQPLKLLWASAEHVLCFDKAEIEMDGKGLVLVRGRNCDWTSSGDPTNVDASRSNGAGKSALLSLPWIALFGKTPKNQVHDAWARQGTEATATVKLGVKLSDDRVMRIVRTRRPSSLRVWVGGQEVTMGRVEQTQALIESLTNLTWDVLTNSVYVGQREIGSVFGTDKERKELFSRLLGLDRFLSAQEKLRKKISSLQRTLIDHGLDIAAAGSALAEARGMLAEVTKGLKEAPPIDRKEKANLERELKTLADEIVRLEKANKDFEPELAANQKEFEECLFKGADIESRMNQMREVIDGTEKVKDGLCPTCGSTVSVVALEKYLKSLQRLVNEADEELAVYERRQQENRAWRKKRLDLLQANTLAIQKHRQRGIIAQRGLTIIEAQIEALERLEADVARRWERVAALERREILFTRVRERLLAHGQFLEFCSSVVGRDGLPSYLCAVAVPHLNTAAQIYSQAFTGGEVSLEFSAQAGDIDIAVKNLHGGEEISDQSHGEMRIAGLIAVFAFRSVLVDYNLLALDEPGEGLDAPNATAFAAGLNSIARQFGSLFLVTHNPHILAVLEPDVRLEVAKHNKISTVTRIV